MNNTKIICTIGNSTSSEEMIRNLINSGMDVARFNMSYSTFDFCEKMVGIIRKLNDELRTNVAIMIDVKTSEIKVNEVENNEVFLKKDTSVIISKKQVVGTEDMISLSYQDLVYDIDVNNEININNDEVILKVISIKGSNIECVVIKEGTIESNCPVRVPNVNINRDFLSTYGKEVIEFASKINADFIALSFIRKYTDLLDVNDLLISLNNDHTQILAKIENQSAINNIDKIIDTCDGVMISRGDLSLDVDLESIPIIQKKIINSVRKTDKIVIVTSELLASMEEKKQPTRAEVSDIANAIIDGSDALMLSAETAIGKYPIESLNYMKKIIVATEKDVEYNFKDRRVIDKNNITNALAYSVADCGYLINAKAIVVSTLSGYTAIKVSSYRPNCPIVVTTPSQEVALSLALNWGVRTIISPVVKTTEDVMHNSVQVAKYLYNLKKGDKIIVTGGFPLEEVKYTNFLKIEEIK